MSSRIKGDRIFGGRAVIAAALMLVAACDAVIAPAQEPSSTDSRSSADQSAKSSGESGLIDDDGKTLWESPTHGRPLKLAYLPPGCQIILAVRPADFAAQPDAEKVVTTLGPIGVRVVQFVKKTVDIPLRDVEQLLVGWQVTHEGNWETALVVGATPEATAKAFDAQRANAAAEQNDDEGYLVAGDRAYWRPKLAEGRVLVIASQSTIGDILDLAGNPPPLRRDVERLLAQTDASRHVTLLIVPSFLFNDGAGIFSGEISRLRDPLFWFLGDDISAAALSLHWGDDFFVELTAVPTLDLPANKMADQLAQRLAKSHERMASYVSALAPNEYSRAVVTRFPEMVRTLAAYTRHRANRDHVVLRSYLPAAAGQNLLMGAELTLAEGGAGSTMGTTVEANSQKSVRERLQQKTSLRFTKDTLETALKMLAADIGAEIIIRGPDLQLDGITKNQSFGIDLADKPAEEILVQILRLANPDKTATGPSDPKQKLVYVVRPKVSGGPEVVFVTTRAAAKKRGDSIPTVFSAK
jgi:hypothetical protein